MDALLASFWKRSLEVSGKVQFQGRHLTRRKWLGGQNAGKVPGIELDLTRRGPASAVRADAFSHPFFVVFANSLVVRTLQNQVGKINRPDSVID